MPQYDAVDAEIFLEDFGVTWYLTAAPGTQYLGIFDTPDEALRVAGIHIESTMYEMMAATEDVNAAGLTTNSGITVDGATYTVRDVLLIDDGLFSRVTMSANA